MCPSNMRSTSSVGRAWYLPGKRSGHEILRPEEAASPLVRYQAVSCCVSIVTRKCGEGWVTGHYVLCGTYHSLREEYGVTVTLVRRVWRKGAGQLPAPPSRSRPAT